MSKTAQTPHWIWASAADGKQNVYACFRFAFDLEFIPRTASLHLSADNEYRLWINGREVAEGPARCFPERQCLDSPDVRGRFRKGRNCICIWAYHFGDISFRSVNTGIAGVIAWGEVRGTRGRSFHFSTGREWKARLDPWHRGETGRISMQLGFQEILAPGPDLDAWVRPLFDDAHWPPAREIGEVGSGPWEEFEPRDIDFFQRLKPVRPPILFRGTADEPRRSNAAKDLPEWAATLSYRTDAGVPPGCALNLDRGGGGRLSWWTFDCGGTPLARPQISVTDARGGEEITGTPS
jgi:hypothetical protein